MEKALLVLENSRAGVRRDECQITIELVVSEGAFDPTFLTTFCDAKLVTLKEKEGQKVVEVNILCDLSEILGYVVISIGKDQRLFRVPSRNLLRLS